MYRGTIAPLITPLDESGEVCQKSVDRLIESIHDEVTGLMPALSSGEGWLLSERQWTDMVLFTKRHSRGLPVLAGIQLPTTSRVIERARLAQRLGVDAAVVTTPFRKDIDQEEIYGHYHALRAAVDIPLFVYNEAAISGNQIELETLARIFRLPAVVGIKESSGSPELTRQIVDIAGSIPVFEGWESLLLRAHGVAGFVGPLANLEPVLCNAMLVDPSPDRQDEINAVCERLGLYRDDWYRHVKAELYARGVIETDRVVEDGRSAA
jgi:4-hydroxy-tetrahydrodipicolinate synthase